MHVWTLLPQVLAVSSQDGIGELRGSIGVDELVAHAEAALPHLHHPPCGVVEESRQNPEGQGDE